MTTAPQANGHAAPGTLVPLSLPGRGPRAAVAQAAAPDEPGQARTPPDDRERRDTRRYPWPLMVIAAPAAVAVWSGWVGLGAMCGFGVVDLLPGIADLRIDTAITLPVGIESYGAYALASWISGKGSVRTRTFAFRSAIGALALGCLGQVAFHLLAAAGQSPAPWPVVMAVACLPVVTLSFAAALVHLKRADAMDGTAGDTSGDQSDDTAGDQPGDTADDSGDDVRDDGTPPQEPRRRRTSAEDKALRVMKRHPGISDLEVVKRAGVSLSTVQRAKKSMGGSRP